MCDKEAYIANWRKKWRWNSARTSATWPNSEIWVSQYAFKYNIPIASSFDQCVISILLVIAVSSYTTKWVEVLLDFKLQLSKTYSFNLFKFLQQEDWSICKTVMDWTIDEKEEKSELISLSDETSKIGILLMI